MTCCCDGTVLWANPPHRVPFLHASPTTPQMLLTEQCKHTRQGVAESAIQACGQFCQKGKPLHQHALPVPVLPVSAKACPALALAINALLGFFLAMKLPVKLPSATFLFHTVSRSPPVAPLQVQSKGGPLRQRSTTTNWNNE